MKTQGEGGDWPLLVNRAGAGALRLALLFGSIAVAMALILTPLAERGTRSVTARAGGSLGVDLTTTGSVPRGGGETYTVRRSVLQHSSDSVCIIRADGSGSGDC